MALQLLPQSTPVSDAAFVQDASGLKMPVRMSLFSRVWWLFLSELTNAVIALQNNPAGSAARPVRAAGTGAALVLTSTYADVPGATITLGDAGDYALFAVFDFAEAGAGDAAQAFLGRFMADGVGIPAAIAVFLPQILGGRATVTSQAIYSPTAAGKIVKLQAEKTGGTGASVLNSTNSSIMVIGPY